MVYFPLPPLLFLTKHVNTWNKRGFFLKNTWNKPNQLTIKHLAKLSKTHYINITNTIIIITIIIKNQESRIKIIKKKKKKRPKFKKNNRLPLATAIFDRVRPTCRRPPELGMNLMPLVPTLIPKHQFKKRSHRSVFAHQNYKQRNIRIIVHILAVRVKIDRPRVPAGGERIGLHVLSDPHTFHERVPWDVEHVGSIHRLCNRRRCRHLRSRAWPTQRRWRRRTRWSGLPTRKYRLRIRRDNSSHLLRGSG